MVDYFVRDTYKEGTFVKVVDSPLYRGYKGTIVARNRHKELAFVRLDACVHHQAIPIKMCYLQKCH